MLWKLGLANGINERSSWVPPGFANNGPGLPFEDAPWMSEARGQAISNHPGLNLDRHSPAGGNPADTVLVFECRSL